MRNFFRPRTRIRPGLDDDVDALHDQVGHALEDVVQQADARLRQVHVLHVQRVEDGVDAPGDGRRDAAAQLTAGVGRRRHERSASGSPAACARSAAKSIGTRAGKMTWSGWVRSCPSRRSAARWAAGVSAPRAYPTRNADMRDVCGEHGVQRRADGAAARLGLGHEPCQLLFARSRSQTPERPRRTPCCRPPRRCGCPAEVTAAMTSCWSSSWPAAVAAREPASRSPARWNGTSALGSFRDAT